MFWSLCEQLCDTCFSRLFKNLSNKVNFNVLLFDGVLGCKIIFIESIDNHNVFSMEYCMDDEQNTLTQDKSAPPGHQFDFLIGRAFHT